MEQKTLQAYAAAWCRWFFWVTSTPASVGVIQNGCSRPLFECRVASFQAAATCGDGYLSRAGRLSIISTFFSLSMPVNACQFVMPRPSPKCLAQRPVASFDLNGSKMFKGSNVWTVQTESRQFTNVEANWAPAVLASELFPLCLKVIQGVKLPGKLAEVHGDSHSQGALRCLIKSDSCLIKSPGQKGKGKGKTSKGKAKGKGKVPEMNEDIEDIEVVDEAIEVKEDKDDGKGKQDASWSSIFWQLWAVSGSKVTLCASSGGQQGSRQERQSQRQ